jgi:hypothetical protein
LEQHRNTHLQLRPPFTRTSALGRRALPMCRGLASATPLWWTVPRITRVGTRPSWYSVRVICFKLFSHGFSLFAQCCFLLLHSFHGYTLPPPPSPRSPPARNGKKVGTTMNVTNQHSMSGPPGPSILRHVEACLSDSCSRETTVTSTKERSVVKAKPNKISAAAQTLVEEKEPGATPRPPALPRMPPLRTPAALLTSKALTPHAADLRWTRMTARRACK